MRTVIQNKKGRKRVMGLVLVLFLAVSWVLSEDTAHAAGYPRVIAHGCGAIEGNTVTNSLEALEHAIEAGYQYIELDLALTSDGQVAMIHDWGSSGSYYLGTANHAVSYDVYRRCRVLNQYTPLTLEKLAEILAAHPQVRIITDTKEDNLLILQTIKQQQPQLLSQMIPQIYQFREYEAVKKLGYETMILTLYRMPNEKNAEKIASFVKERKLYAVTMSAQKSNHGLARALQGQGIRVYMHTVNSLSDTMTALQAGAYGIYSDLLLPEEVTYPGWQYYLTPSSKPKQQLSIELQHNGLQLRMATPNKSGTVSYHVEGQGIAKGPVNTLLKADLSKVTNGAHTVEATIWDKDGRKLAVKQYQIWKDGSCVLLLSPQCSYILEQFHTLGDFSEILKQQDAAVQEIARESMFFQVGSAVYYSSGKTGIFLNGTTLLPAITADSHHNIYTPYSETAKLLGADSVLMNSRTLSMDVRYQKKKYQVGLRGLTRQYHNNGTILRNSILLHRNRAMGDGRAYQELTGRAFVQRDGYLILLPAHCTVEDATAEALLAVARQLYQ